MRITIDKDLISWRYHDFPEAVTLWVHLLLMANTEDGYRRGEPVKKGSLSTSISELQSVTGIGSDNTIRKWLKKFEAEGMIKRQSLQFKRTLITIINYEKYAGASAEQGAYESAGASAEQGAYESAEDTAEVSALSERKRENEEESEEERTKEEDKEEGREEKESFSPKLPLKGESHRAEAESIVDYLNNLVGTHYRKAEGTLRPIIARLNEGFTVQDCWTVIDKKAKDWLNDERMVKYLRPETLFAKTKFESYLNELEAKPKPKQNGYYHIPAPEEHKRMSDEDFNKMMGWNTNDNSKNG